MARKYDLISEVYNRTCKTVTANPASWQAFLRSACRNYKLRFDEQLLVFAQRPDATAVLEIERWNGTFGRWVNKGATGIAVFEDVSRKKQRLIHYFDISDTHPSRYSRPVPIWEMKPEYEAEVIETLESTFGELRDKDSLANAVLSAAQNAVEDNLPDYTRDLHYSVRDSFLEELDEDTVTTFYKRAVTNSVAYMMMARLGLDAGDYFEREDFEEVLNFNTQDTLNGLGFATSDIAEMGLAEIARTVLSLDRQNRIIAENRSPEYNEGRNQNKERSPQNERTDLHDAGGLQAPEPENAGAAGEADRTLRTPERAVSEGEPQGKCVPFLLCMRDVFNAAHAKRCLYADACKIRKIQQCVCKLSVEAVQLVFQCQLSHEALDGIPLQIIGLVMQPKAAWPQPNGQCLHSLTVLIFDRAFGNAAVPFLH